VSQAVYDQTTVTLKALDSHDANVTRECIEPIDDAREAKILYQINAIIRRSNLCVRFLPWVVRELLENCPHFASFGWP
jgi:hypothetical protein